MPLVTENTTCTRDVFGRYACNTLQEALARRAAERLLEKPFISAPNDPVQPFDGATLNGWTQAGPGNFVVDNGALYDVQPPLVLAAKPPGQWNNYVIRVVRQIYNVTLNGQPVIVNFEGNRSARGFIGLQNHLPKDVVFFRNIVVTPL